MLTSQNKNKRDAYTKLANYSQVSCSPASHISHLFNETRVTARRSNRAKKVPKIHAKTIEIRRYGMEGRQKGAVKIFSKCCKRALLSGTVLQLDITHKHINLLKHSNTASVFVSHIYRRKLLPIDFQSDYSKRFQSYTSNVCLSNIKISFYSSTVNCCSKTKLFFEIFFTQNQRSNKMPGAPFGPFYHREILCFKN